jgi:hypothetical protein
MVETTYTQTAGMAGDVATDNVAEIAQQAVDAAAAAAADLLLTDADTVATAADRAQTTADRAQTTADRVAVAADLVATNQDTIDTAADAVSTAADVVTTNADAATTTQDAIDTAADVVTTNADAATTTQDAIDTAAAAAAAANSASAASTSASEAAASAGSVTVDAASVTAAGALMDSELTSIADIKALDQSVISGATPTFGIANVTLDDTSLVVSDTTNLQTFAEGVDSALLRARGTGFTSTYVSTVTIGGTTFAQPAVNGEIHSDQGYFAIAYAGATGITVATLSAPSTYVYVDNAGNLQQQTSTPTRQDWSRKMFTMRIAVDTSAETIIGFEYLGNPIGHYANSIRDLYKALLEQGVPFKGGQTITGRAADLGFDVSAGTLMEFGGTGNIDNANVLSIDAVANAEYTLIERTGAGTTGQTSLVKSWDNAESITALGSGTFVAHRVYRFSNGTFVIQYGQGNYANIVLARAGLLIEDYVLNDRLINATFFGWWIVGETATNTGGTTLTEFREYTIGVQGGSSSGLAGCLLKGNNLSDLLDASAARTNLGLGDVATTAAAAYATAAQGTLADDAAPLASPTFTGTPAAATATVGTDTTQIATTAFVLANGSAGVGSDVQTFTSSGTWTKPAGITWVLVEAVGGGAGGPNTTGSGNFGGGGGGAGVQILLLASTLAATETVTIGAGGVGIANGVLGFTGNPGGDTTLGSQVTARGGAGGTSSQGGLAGGGESPNNVGTPSGGGYSSGAGGAGSGTGGSCVLGGAGGGGGSAGGVSEYGGNGGAGSYSSGVAGSNGSVPGGGGGASTGNGGGGSGGNGRMVVKSW